MNEETRELLQQRYNDFRAKLERIVMAFDADGGGKFNVPQLQEIIAEGDGFLADPLSIEYLDVETLELIVRFRRVAAHLLKQRVN